MQGDQLREARQRRRLFHRAQQAQAVCGAHRLDGVQQRPVEAAGDDQRRPHVGFAEAIGRAVLVTEQAAVVALDQQEFRAAVAGLDCVVMTRVAAWVGESIVANESVDAMPGTIAAAPAA